MPTSLPIEEVYVNERVIKITLKNVRDKPGIAADIFRILANKGINVELIVGGPGSKGYADIAFLILESQLPKLEEVKEEILKEVNAKDMVVDKDVVLLSFYGRDLYKVPGIAYKVFNAFATGGINIEMIATSRDSLSCVIRQKFVDAAKEVVSEFLGIEVKKIY